MVKIGYIFTLKLSTTRNFNLDPIILASASPRRQEILKLLNIPFAVRPANISEIYPESLPSDSVAEYLATEKVKSIINSTPDGQTVPWILGADTVIVHEDRIYGKPSSREEASSFLHQLQGKTHKVITGVALHNGREHTLTSRSSMNLVTFAQMSDEEIEWYINTGEWHGAAGAYKIQGLASCFITKIEGSESGVMGLPIYDIYDMLKAQNYSIIE